MKLVINGDHLYFKEFIDVLTDNGYKVKLIKTQTCVEIDGVEEIKDEYEVYIED